MLRALVYRLFWVLLLGAAIPVFAQPVNYNQKWVNGSPWSNITDFATANPTDDFWDTTATTYFRHGHSTICDAAGDVLFATDGTSIFGKNKAIIPNGDSIAPNVFYEYGKGSFSTQGTIILPVGDSLYYVFNCATLDSQAYQVFILGIDTFLSFDYLGYALVDMKANNYTGSVLTKKQQMLPAGLRVAPSQMTAVRHANGQDWWLVKSGTHLQSRTITYLVTKDSITGPYIQDYNQPPTQYGGLWTGQSAFSNNGNLFATVCAVNQLFVADFDRCTGVFSNDRLIVPPSPLINNVPGTADTSLFGVAFSPNDSFIYLGKYFNILQYELYNLDSATAWYHLAGIDTTPAAFNNYLNMALAHNGRIYIGTSSFYPGAFSVIDNPNQKGALAGFCPRCLRFRKRPQPNGLFASPMGLPNMPNYVLGASSDPCLPPLSVAAPTEDAAIRLYPNPATTHITLEDNGLGGTLTLTDMLGRTLLEQALPKGSVKHIISTGQLPAGVYTWRYEELGDGVRMQGKVVIGD